MYALDKVEVQNGASGPYAVAQEMGLQLQMGLSIATEKVLR